jgi:hypothetical protein
MGTIAIDGSKVKANASKHKAMSYDRMLLEEKKLRSEIRKLTQAARSQDDIDDKAFGPDFRGDELPVLAARGAVDAERPRARIPDSREARSSRSTKRGSVRKPSCATRSRNVSRLSARTR